MKVDPLIDAAIKGKYVGYNEDDPEKDNKTGIVPTGFRSKGIVVDLPATMKIGFYIKNGSNIMYSEGKLNHKKTWTDHSEEIDACYIATYESEETDAAGKPIRYLAFEDWYNTGDYDLNDIVFRVYGIEDVIDHEEITEEGLFVCEDLGDYDFDFNDIVLKASWKRYYKKTYHKDVNGVVISVEIAQEPSDELTITGMAAGGANPSEVYFKTASKTSGQQLGEIHEILNGAAPSIINAGPKYGRDGLSFKFEEYEFPETWNKTKYPNGYVSQMFGEGLLYIIASTDNSIDQPAGASNVEATRIISGDKYKTIGVPQVMLMPTTYEWCQESQPINEVYPKFIQWVENASVIDWFVDGKVESRTTDRGVTAAAINNTPASGGDDIDDGNDDSGNNKAQDIVCNVSEIESITLWGTAYHGQTIQIPSDGVEAGDKLIITSNNANKDFGTSYGNSSYAQGNRTEITITDAMIGSTIYVTLYDGSDKVTKAVISKNQ